ncbi:translation initiation factor IF-2 [Candidatus Phytoplasma phoenicium]|uniref:Translation initiation factor IF-2 n=1 Tax=Candidatus Phytoplasma phoenicium TaxID=198422 RepID=A0A0L0MJN5_9MOLU|nr:translation initiation factor IF-2 [Candidatus Phytoplasma phoenicium]KND62496.1 Translation initiation factor 2 [Candidatus Phytoplasma phoenicium]
MNTEKKQQNLSHNPVKTKNYIFNPKDTIKDLSNILEVSNIFLIKKLIQSKIKTNINQLITKDIIEILSRELDFQVIYSEPKTHFNVEKTKPVTASVKPHLIHRTPIVTVMGHVDHGKTTLLDSIRQTRMVDKEFGGITQHIGAYEVVYKENKITFIDSPGHESFSQMRSRGAQITDICVLVVAADDGVKPQTIESVQHAQNANVEIVVAINKIDKTNNKKENIMFELSNLGLTPEEWGGKTPYIEISALHQKGIDNLLQTILLISEMQNIQTDLNQVTCGVVLEASLNKNKGPVATLISSQGILRKGDIIVAGNTFGKIRSIEDHTKKQLLESFPSQPVLITGLSQVPQAGDSFIIVDELKIATKIVEERKNILQENKRLYIEANKIEENVFELDNENPIQYLNIILKTDTQGSIEVIQETLAKLNNDEIKINFVKKAVGMITDNDIDLAKTFNAILINFNNPLRSEIKKLAQSTKIIIQDYKIIYKIVEDIEKEIKKLMKPLMEEKVTGQAEIRRIFHISSINENIAGCYVINGTIYSNALAKVIRNKKIIYRGKIISLKHLKNNISSASQGYECGILLENFNNFQINDIIETSKLEKVIIK